MTRSPRGPVFHVMEAMTHVLPTTRATTASRCTKSAAAADGLQVAAADLAEGKLQALDRIWQQCADELYGLALWRTGRPADAEDAVQEVFVRLARMPKRLRDARNPRSYLLRMAHNAAVDLYKRRRPDEQLDPEAAYAVTDDTGSLENRLDADRINRLLAELPAAQREVVFLHHYAELPFRRIGQVTGVPTFTAASRYRLAMRKLRRLMGVSS